MATKYKITLATGKTVVMRQMKIKDYHNAAGVAGVRAAGNTALMSMTMQDEILKNLIEKINDKPVPVAEKEDLDSLFEVGEYHQLQKHVEEALGKNAAPSVEMIQE